MVKAILPQVEAKVKGDFPLMEIVTFVENAMKARGWDKATLTRESGASSAAVTRFFQDGMINSLNTLKILCCLDLLRTDADAKSCPVGCDPEMQRIARDVKEILSSGTHWGKSLEYNIQSFRVGYKGEKETDENLLEVIKNLNKTVKEMQDEIKSLRRAM